MVTLGTYHRKDGEEIVLTNTYYGLSTDSKPSDGEKNGSCFIEIDTGTVSFFDAVSGEWYAVSAGGGGGSGGGGSASGMVVEFAKPQDQDALKSDKTGEEIVTAFKAGTTVIFHFPKMQDWYWEEAYATVTAFYPHGTTNTGIDNLFQVVGIDESFYNFSNAYIADDGYVHADIYVD